MLIEVFRQIEFSHNCEYNIGINIAFLSRLRNDHSIIRQSHLAGMAAVESAIAKAINNGIDEAQAADHHCGGGWLGE